MSDIITALRNATRDTTGYIICYNTTGQQCYISERTTACLKKILMNGAQLNELRNNTIQVVNNKNAKRYGNVFPVVLTL